MTDKPVCDPHPELVGFRHPLPHFQRSLKRQRKTRVVAMGSSSTAGANDVLPYPARLEFLLRQSRFGRLIDVVNRGIGGQEAPEELSRFECDVIAENPALVIWQVGTNAVFHNDCYNLDEVEKAIEIGLDLLSELPTDVVLVDLQYTAEIVSDPVKRALCDDVEKRIARVAARADINLFSRWTLMQAWLAAATLRLEDLDDRHQPYLHMSEWATACMTEALYKSIMSAPNV